MHNFSSFSEHYYQRYGILIIFVFHWSNFAEFIVILSFYLYSLHKMGKPWHNKFLPQHFIFFISMFHICTLKNHGAGGKGRGPFLFLFTSSTCTQTLRHLFGTVPLRCALPVFIAEYFIIRRLLDEIYLPLTISIWFYVCWTLLVDIMLDVLDFSSANCRIELKLVITLLIILTWHLSKWTGHPISTYVSWKVSISY